MSDATPSQRIVPDADQSLSAHHLRHRRGPTLWPLWLLLILVIALLGVLAAGLWYERERLLDEVRRVSGEVSNLHARLDSGDADVIDSITYMQAQMSTLFQEQEQLVVRLNDTRSELFGVLTDGDELAPSDELAELRQALDAQIEATELNERQLEALANSLSALERAGASGRQNLLEELAYLDRNSTERIATLEEQVERVEELAEAVSSNDGGVDQQALDSAIATLDGRLNALESDVRQVRQAQLAFSAQMEMLR